MVKFISYNGSYSNLCSGDLIFSKDGEERTAYYVLISGGGLEPNYEGTYYGSWELDQSNSAFFDFSGKDFNDLLEEVNKNVQKGCCGGCI
jgi:hypothetical protein